MPDPNKELIHKVERVEVTRIEGSPNDVEIRASGSSSSSGWSEPELRLLDGTGPTDVFEFVAKPPATLDGAETPIDVTQRATISGDKQQIQVRGVHASADAVPPPLPVAPPPAVPPPAVPPPAVPPPAVPPPAVPPPAVPPKSVPSARAALIASAMQFGIFGLLGIGFVGFLGWGILPKHGEVPLLQQLGQDAVARGLITFIIAIVTAAIALILTLASILSESPDAERRVARGREVLTALIGVLGTIVGFYFGVADDQTPNGAVQSAAFAMARVLEPGPAHPGETVHIAAIVPEGTPPYEYTIVFTPDVIQIPKRTATSRLIQEEVVIPATVTDTPVIEFRINATSADGKPHSLSGSIQMATQ